MKLFAQTNGALSAQPNPAVAGGGPSLPHDIVGLSEYPLDPWPWVIGAVVFCIVAVLVFWLVKRLRARKKPVVSVVETPRESLLRHLSQLSVPSPYSHSAGREFFYQLSQLIRQAIEATMFMRATDLTVSELEQQVIPKIRIQQIDNTEMITFLRRADLIKFADQNSSAEEAERAMKLVLQWSHVFLDHHDSKTEGVASSEMV